MTELNSNIDLDHYYLDLEEDYENIYKDGWRPDPFGESVIPVGMCSPNMCTLEEMQERERQNRLNKYETIPHTRPPKVDSKTAMKEYTRSAAGREFSRAIHLRPWSVLRRGLHHLLLNICFKSDEWMFICDFVFDRLKSIRQDMIIQRIEGRRYIEVLEVILSEEGTPVSGLSNYEVNVVREMKLTMQCLRDCLHSLIVQYQDNVPDSPNRSLFEAINLIVNLPFLHHSQFCRTDYQSKSELRNSDPMFKIVFKMYREHLAGNHLAALKRLPDLIDHPLVVLAYAPAIAQLQVHILTTLKKLYASRGQNTTHPNFISKLLCPEWLDVNNAERLIFTVFLCTQCGVYDDDSNCCDFSMQAKKVVIPTDFAHKAEIERHRQLKARDCEGDNETRIYALQMLAGRNWSFYQESLNVFGINTVLDPTQPAD